jgi:hypothetical protein
MKFSASAAVSRQIGERWSAYETRVSWLFKRTHSFKKHCGKRMRRVWLLYYIFCIHGEVVDWRGRRFLCDCCGCEKI